MEAKLVLSLDTDFANDSVPDFATEPDCDFFTVEKTVELLLRDGDSEFCPERITLRSGICYIVNLTMPVLKQVCDQIVQEYWDPV